jgi:hypothetical protein
LGEGIRNGWVSVLEFTLKRRHIHSAPHVLTQSHFKIFF